MDTVSKAADRSINTSRTDILLSGAGLMSLETKVRATVEQLFMLSQLSELSVFFLRIWKVIAFFKEPGIILAGRDKLTTEIITEHKSLWLNGLAGIGPNGHAFIG